MTKDKLLGMQAKINSLHSIVTAINSVWDTSLIEMCQVLLQNAGHSSLGCVNGGIEKDIETIKNVNKCLSKLNDYNSDYHFINWLFQEYDMIVFEFLYMDDASLDSEEIIQSDFDRVIIGSDFIVGPVNL